MSTDSHVGSALVTGGAVGIGRAICFALARGGYDVGVFDVVDEPKGYSAALAEFDVRSAYTKVDVSQEHEVERAYADVCAHLGQPSVLVNNAGIYPRIDVLAMSYAQWQHVMAVNLGGAFLCSRAVAPAMLARGTGSIVNIASGRALQGAADGCHYAASKAGILSLTRSLALAWGPSIRVNAVIPGLTDTAQPRQSGLSDEQLHARADRLPLKRIGKPEDVASAVGYLVSPQAAYVTGQSLCVNGGSIMH